MRMATPWFRVGESVGSPSVNSWLKPVPKVLTSADPPPSSTDPKPGDRRKKAGKQEKKPRASIKRTRGKYPERRANFLEDPCVPVTLSVRRNVLLDWKEVAKKRHVNLSALVGRWVDFARALGQ